MLGGMLTKDRKPPDGFSDWDSFYEHGAREILPKLERAPSPCDHVRQRCTWCGYHDVCIHATECRCAVTSIVSAALPGRVITLPRRRLETL